MSALADAPGFGLYVHWPFCQSKCPYCDFNSHVASHIDQDRWARAYLAELERTAAETGSRQLTSVFFGGGTPSLMKPDLVYAVLDRIRSLWQVANDWEVTLEANPTSVEAHKFAAFRQAGVSRVSLGIQALNDCDLRALGRLHTAAEAMRAYDVARSSFDRVSFDLIYARQDQALEDWSKELGFALSLNADHMSLYQLTVEDGTAFGDRLAQGRLSGLPDEHRAAALYDVTQNLCEAAGLPAYEVSNHARPGAECRHNLIYWRAGDYAGIGPGAHGRLTLDDARWATVAVRAPGAWLAQIESTGHGELPRERISPVDQGLEYLMMGLRLSEGIDTDRFKMLASAALDTDAIGELTALGMIHVSSNRIKASAEGRLVLNAVIRRLAQGL